MYALNIISSTSSILLLTLNAFLVSSVILILGSWLEGICTAWLVYDNRRLSLRDVIVSVVNRGQLLTCTCFMLV